MICSLTFRAMGMNFFKFLSTALLAALFGATFTVGQAAAEDRFSSLSCEGREVSREEGGVLKKVEESYSKLETLTARFFQESYFLGADTRRRSEGQVVFQRPGKMDWQYSQPDLQRFSSDGKTVWWYQPNENQVVVRTLAQSFVSDVPVSFLLGVGKLHENFRFDSRCGTSDETLIKLLPLKPSASLDVFYLLVDPKDFSPIGARIVNVGGNETSIYFEDRKLNGTVDAKRFVVDVPKGTDVIDERSAAHDEDRGEAES